MRALRFLLLAAVLAALLILPVANRTVESFVQQQPDQANRAASTDATYTSGSVDLEGVAEDDTTTFFFTGKEEEASTTQMDAIPNPADDVPPDPCTQPPIQEAPAFGFDDFTNGLVEQGDPKEPAEGTFLADKETFEEVDQIEKGLGPVYNAQSCKECHQNPVTGAISQINELRAGHTVNNVFFDAPGGSLINQRGIPTDNYDDPTHKSAKVQERIPPLYTAGIVGGGAPITGEEKTRTFRTSLNTLGDGFVEAVADGTLVSMANKQKGDTHQEVHGLVINVPVLEANNRKRVGRFGWKNQHASLLSFSADAYLNEIGITNKLILIENTSLGRFVGFGSGFDKVRDDKPCIDHPLITCGEDEEEDIDVFAEFMRATQAPPQDKDIQNDPRFAADINIGRQLFESMNGQYSCSVCHVPTIQTSNRCQPLNGDAFRTPLALARKRFHPFGDFLLHDIGTGDFIVQNGGQVTRTTVRTAPLWGVRTRVSLMHDGETHTFREAILRHDGEAQQVRLRFQALSEDDKRRLIMFLESL